jgi:two-component system NtrC family sensor kinase
LNNRVPANLPDVLADPHDLQHVLLNLLTNARQALKGNPSAAIELDGFSDEEGVGIIIRDNGPGIRAEHLDRIFDPFFTTKPPGEGTGLGLSISHSIMKNNEGHLSVESRPGAGAAFTIRLPAASPLDDPKT